MPLLNMALAHHVALIVEKGDDMNKKWDVFISYASEDRKFVGALADALLDYGVSVWFDQFELQPGDSLRRVIDQGIRESQYGVVVLSRHFFDKEWPQKELDALVSREDNDQKVIIPVWRDVDAATVRKHAPLLSGKLSIYSAAPVSDIARRITTAIYRDRLKAGYKWSPILLRLTNDTTVSVLPVSPRGGMALAVACHPTTNAQYKSFVTATSSDAPIGESFADGEWSGPFIPWEMPGFREDDVPVVCVNLSHAREYCRWLNELMWKDNEGEAIAFIPHGPLWNFAATGACIENRELQQYAAAEAHKAWHCKDTPRPVNAPNSQASSLGMVDMFGNVWEWCEGIFDRFFGGFSSGTRYTEVELRGGGFRDDLGCTRPFVPSVSILESGVSSCHFDIGFRAAFIIRLSTLTREDAMRLSGQQRLSSMYWRVQLQDPFSYEHLRDEKDKEERQRKKKVSKKFWEFQKAIDGHRNEWEVEFH